MCWFGFFLSTLDGRGSWRSSNSRRRWFHRRVLPFCPPPRSLEQLHRDVQGFSQPLSEVTDVCGLLCSPRSQDRATKASLLLPGYRVPSGVGWSPCKWRPATKWSPKRKGNEWSLALWWFHSIMPWAPCENDAKFRCIENSGFVLSVPYSTFNMYHMKFDFRRIW